MKHTRAKFRSKYRNVFLAVFGLIILTVAAKALILGQACTVEGTARLYGHFAEKGLPIIAYIEGEKVAESAVREDGKYQLTIPEYDPAKPEIRGYHSPSDIVLVKINGKEARPTFSPRTSNLKIDLGVEQSLDVKLSTWGRIKALFK